MDASDDGWLLQGSADPADVAAYYDEWAQRYDADLDGWAYRAPAVVAGVVMEHAPQAHSVLDAGCGTGRSGRALRSAGYRRELHGIDVSEDSLAIAEQSEAYTSVAAGRSAAAVGVRRRLVRCPDVRRRDDLRARGRGVLA